MDNERKSSIINYRPLFFAALCLALGIVIGRYTNFSVIYIIAAAVLAIAAFCLRKKWVILLVCASFAFAGVFMSSLQFDAEYIDTEAEMQVQGRVTGLSYVSYYGDTIVVLDNTKIEGQKSGKIKLYIGSEDELWLAPGDIIEAVADVEIPKGVRNPGGYNERLQYLSQGIYYKAYTQTVTVTGHQGGLIILSAAIREHIGSVIDDIFEDDVQAVAKAMLLGEKYDLDDVVYSTFKDTGMAHVLAVSGLHAGILIGFFYLVLKWLRAGRRVKLIVTLVFVVIYACVTGLTPSIVRACIMASALLIGNYFGRQSDSINYLSAAFIISLLINPLSLFSVSFMLSFGAVFSIITLGWQINHWLAGRTPGWMSKVNGAVSVSAGATAGTLPFLALKFNRISTFSFLTNIFIIPLASVAIVMVFITTAAGLVFAEFGTWLAYASGFVVRILIKVIDWVAAVPFVAVDIASPPWYLILVIMLMLFVTSKFVLIKTWVKAALCTGIVVIVVCTMLLSGRSGMYLVFLDVGQGDAAFIRTYQGGEYFIDGGREKSSDEVVDFSIRNDIRPNAAFVTHSDADHFSGMKALYDKGLLKKVYCSYQESEYIKEQLPEAEIVRLCAGDIVWLDEYTTAKVLYPYKETQTDDKNEASLVLLVEYNGYRVLFTGDILGQTETLIFSEIGKVDIYKVAHHGSKYSSYQLPLSNLNPDYSIVSAGYNTFGHPHPFAIANLEEYSGKVYTTINDYAVEFYIDEGIKVKTYGDMDG